MTKTLFYGLTLSIILLLSASQIGIAQAPPVISLGNSNKITEVARLGKGQTVHFDWTPEHQLVVTTSAGIWLYNAEDQIKDIPTPLRSDYTGTIIAVAGRTIFLLHQDNSLSVQNSETGQERQVLPPNDEGTLGLAVSSDGTRLAFTRASFRVPKLVSKDNFAIHVWNVQTAKELYVIDVQASQGNSLQFSPSGNKLAAATADGTIMLWDVQTGKQLNAYNSLSPFLISFNPMGNLLAVGTTDDIIQLLDIQTGKILKAIQTNQRSINYLVFSPDGQTLASASWIEPDIKIWSVVTGQAVTTLNGHQGGVFALSFNPNGLSLLSGSEDETVREWDTKTWNQKTVLNGFMNHVSSIAFVPKSDLLVSGTSSIRFWDTKTATSKQMVRPNPDWAWIESLAITPDGKQLITASNDSLQVWDIATMLNPVGLEKGEIRHVALSSNGLLALTLAGMDIELWDIRKHSLLYTLMRHKDIISSLAFSPNGDFLASVSGIIQGDVVYTSDNTLRIWETHTGTERATFQGANHLYSVAISPDGKIIATGTSNGIIQLWSMDTKIEIGRLTENDNIIRSLLFSSDGSLLFAGGSDTLIHIWDVKGQTEIRTLKGQLGSIDDLILNAAGTLLASGSADGTIRMWGVR